MSDPSTPLDPGFLAISEQSAGAWNGDVEKIAVQLGAVNPYVARRAGSQIAGWGLVDEADVVRTPGGRIATALTSGARRGERDLTQLDLDGLLSPHGGRLLAEMLPPFGVLGEEADGGLVAATDVLGFRHLYHCEGPGWSGVSTSARALAQCSALELDRCALAVQSLLGWQLGNRTIFSGIEKLAAGHLVELAHGRRTVRRYAPQIPPARLSLDEAARSAAIMLRDYLEALIDDHPDTVIQLTGGQDSRILLSAIPTARRRGLSAMTLAVPGSQDALIAATIAARYGLKHRIVELTGVEKITPEAAHAACLQAARRIEGMSDPIAFAALTIAETGFSHERRLSGLGGEVARGFYYFGPLGQGPVTQARTARLAQWRMFANESVAEAALEPDFARWARDFTVEEIFRLLSGTGLDWMSATDEFYLSQRMQRWAGVVDTAICFDRVVVNPMLDQRFLSIARGLRPADKQGSRFLGLLQLQLDPELARLPLDGRPAPEVFADPSPLNRARIAATAGAKVLNKVRQKAAQTRRPPAGGDILAAKVVEHWRAAPEILAPVRGLGIYREQWLDAVVSGAVQPAPSSLALLINLTAALG